MDGPADAHVVQELNQLEEVILSKIAQRVKAGMSQDTFVIKTLRYYDLNNSGWLEFEKFKRAMNQFIAGINEEDLHLIYDRYSVQGLLPVKQFSTEFVTGARRTLPFPGGEAPVAPQDRYEEPEETLGRIKQFLNSQGPRGLISLALALGSGDPPNHRTLDAHTFGIILTDFFQDSGCEVTEEQAFAVFDLFKQPYEPTLVAYDELLLALKDEPSAARRSAIRAAFRRLDAGSEGLVDGNQMIRSFNANRHPQVAGGLRKADEVLEEFADTLKDLVAFRRGQRSNHTNLVAWEEFEDYYKLISGCYADDELFCTILQKVWDLDKVPDPSIEARLLALRPAAGAPSRSRAGLHHWQDDTLHASSTHYKIHHFADVEQVMLRARSFIASRGLRYAVDVVKTIYDADDDVDDKLDSYDFRRAVQRSGLAFKDVEEASIWEVLGGGTGPQAKIDVRDFLRLLHGDLAPQRRTIIERAFASLGGDPSDVDSKVTPAVLKERFAAEAHPLVVRGELHPDTALAEFLDTFSLLAHVLGGCQDGRISFKDFLAYYDVVSSTIDNDARFELLLQRIWSLPAAEAQS